MYIKTDNNNDIKFIANDVVLVHNRVEIYNYPSGYLIQTNSFDTRYEASGMYSNFVEYHGEVPADLSENINNYQYIDGLIIEKPKE